MRQVVACKRYKTKGNYFKSRQPETRSWSITRDSCLGSISKGMSIDDGIVMCGRVLSAAATEPWLPSPVREFDLFPIFSRLHRQKTDSFMTADGRPSYVVSVILNLQFHVALSELGSLFSFVLEFFTWVPDIRSWVSEYRISSDKWPGAYLKFRLRGRALILCLTVTPSKIKRQTNCWFTRDVTAAMLVVKNKSISLLWELNFIFM